MFKPLRDFVVVQLIKEDEKVGSGLLYKPGNAEDKNAKGIVVAVGSGHLTGNGAIVPLEVAVGDTIMFMKSMSVEVKQGGETAFILREENILSVLT